MLVMSVTAQFARDPIWFAIIFRIQKDVDYFTSLYPYDSTGLYATIGSLPMLGFWTNATLL